MPITRSAAKKNISSHRKLIAAADGAYGVSVQRITNTDLADMTDEQRSFLAQALSVCDPTWIYTRWLKYLVDKWMTRPRSRIYVAVKVPFVMQSSTGYPEVIGLVMCGDFFNTYMVSQGYPSPHFVDKSLHPDRIFQIYAVCKAQNASGPIARVLMAHALQFADEVRSRSQPKYTAAILDVAYGEDNKKAMGLYRDMNFIPTRMTYGKGKEKTLMVKNRGSSFLDGISHWLKLPDGLKPEVLQKSCSV